MNSINLIGRLTRDPELKYFDSGKAVAKFSIAVNRPTKDKVADFFDCEAWNQTSEIVGNYCTKGKQVGIQGRVEFEHWETKTGEKRSKPVVKVDRLDLLGGGESNGAPQPADNRLPAPVDADDIAF